MTWSPYLIASGPTPSPIRLCLKRSRSWGSQFVEVLVHREATAENDLMGDQIFVTRHSLFGCPVLIKDIDQGNAGFATLILLGVDLSFRNRHHSFQRQEERVFQWAKFGNGQSNRLFTYFIMWLHQVSL